jgi:hypothetical protein
MSLDWWPYYKLATIARPARAKRKHRASGAVSSVGIESLGYGTHAQAKLLRHTVCLALGELLAASGTAAERFFALSGSGIAG